jgi:hypothetical protein
MPITAATTMSCARRSASVPGAQTDFGTNQPIAAEASFLGESNLICAASPASGPGSAL